MGVYSLPGGFPKKMVLVHVSQEHQAILLSLQSVVSNKFMQYAYKEGEKPSLPSLGTDYSKVYGYAEDHKSAEEELLKWLAQYDDILENGTPPPWIRCTDFPSHLWNKLMGFVDLPRKVIKSKRAIRGPDSKPGSLMWLNMFGYILFQAWRKYQDSRLIQLRTTLLFDVGKFHLEWMK